MEADRVSAAFEVLEWFCEAARTNLPVTNESAQMALALRIAQCYLVAYQGHVTIEKLDPVPALAATINARLDAST